MPYLDLSSYEREPIAFLKTKKGDIPIFDTNVAFGRDNSNNIVLEDSWVSRKHAQIIYERQTLKFFFRDLNSANGTYVNNKYVKNGMVELTSVSNIKISAEPAGTTEITFVQVFGLLTDLVTKMQYKILPEQNRIIGRAGDIKLIPENISRNHVSITFNFKQGYYTIKDHSTNGTYIGDTKLEKESEVRLKDNYVLSLAKTYNFQFNHYTDIPVSQKKSTEIEKGFIYTQYSTNKLLREGKLTKGPDGRYYYEGRPLIHRDSPIDGGVYLVANIAEAVVVDSKKYPKIREVYGIAKNKATSFSLLSSSKEITEEKILKAVYDTVDEIMDYKTEDIDEIIKRLNVEHNGKIALDVFIEKRIGVCRQQALLCGVLIELFIKEGFLHGKISVERNQTAFGGHAWARYTDSKGEIWILDVAQHYFGLLSNSKGQNRWAYERPEDAQY